MTGNQSLNSAAWLGRVTACLASTLLIVLVLASPASAQEDPYNPDPPQVTLADDEVCEGDSIVVTVSGAEPGDSIDVSFAGQTASITAGGGGSASTSFSTEGSGSGTHSVVATTGSGGSASASVVVLDDQTCAPSTPPSIAVADPAVCVGETAVATVSGGTPGESVTISLAGQSTGVTVGANGTASASFNTANLSPGSYSFVVSGSAGQTASAPLEVLSADHDECREIPNETDLGVAATDTCVSDPLVVSITGAAGGEGVTISFAGTSLGVTAGPDGSAQASLPTDGLSPGRYSLLATAASGAGSSTQVTVLGGADGCAETLDQGGSRPRVESTSSGEPLAFTGSSTRTLVVAGVVLIVLGGLLTWRSRRSRAA